MEKDKLSYLVTSIIVFLSALALTFSVQYFNDPTTEISIKGAPEENVINPASLPDTMGEIIENGEGLPFGEVHQRIQEVVIMTALPAEDPDEETVKDEQDSKENGEKDDHGEPDDSDEENGTDERDSDENDEDPDENDADTRDPEEEESLSVAEELGISEISYIRYTTTALNIRSDATIEGERIGVFSEGAEVHVIGEVPNDWVQVDYGDTEAFVHGGYLQETDPAEAPDEEPAEEPSVEEETGSDDNGEDDSPSVAEELGVSEVSYIRYSTTALNIRADAHNEAERIGVFSEGAEVHVIGELSNNWVQVEYEGTDAFVHSAYLTATDPTEAPADDGSDTDPGEDEDSVVVISNPSAIDVLVNREYRLPADFTPPNLVEPDVPIAPNANNRLLRSEAASALESLFDAAAEDGVMLYARSGYRSYSTQETLFNNYVANHGYEEASRFSAKPGHSEHQTGLAMDVTSESADYRLTQDFGNTSEGQWVAANAHHYGFIIRYPQNKESVTGYIYEPWHLRYLGVDLATAVYESGLTYEEYLGY